MSTSKEFDRCLGCDIEFSRTPNYRPLCGKCKKIARDAYVDSGGSAKDFRVEIAGFKGEK
jgi:hypothetical protein